MDVASSGPEIPLLMIWYLKTAMSPGAVGPPIWVTVNSTFVTNRSFEAPLLETVKPEFIALSAPDVLVIAPVAAEDGTDKVTEKVQDSSAPRFAPETLRVVVPDAEEPTPQKPAAGKLVAVKPVSAAL